MITVRALEKNPLRQQISLRWWLAIALCLVVAPAIAAAEADSTETPVNSHAKLYGSGWTCNPGYRAIGDQCIPEKV